MVLMTWHRSCTAVVAGVGVVVVVGAYHHPLQACLSSWATVVAAAAVAFVGYYCIGGGVVVVAPCRRLNCSNRSQSEEYGDKNLVICI